MVRETLGEDAIIVATGEEKNAVGGSMVHITAAVDKDTIYGDNHDHPDDFWIDDGADDEATVLEEITETMLRHSVPEEILDQIVSCAGILGAEEPRLALLSSIESLFKFNPLPTESKARPLIMIGPPGAGKTLAVAKLAARSSMNGSNVAVITADTERAGGREQLEAFTTLMDIELRTAKSPTALKEMLLETKGSDQVIIDTAGTNPFDLEQVKSLARYIGAAELDPVLVMPANTNAEEAAEMAEIFATIGAERLLPTRVDAARRLGSILASAYKGGLSLSDVSTTAKVADGLSQLTSKRLTQLLMPRAEGTNIQNVRKAG